MTGLQFRTTNHQTDDRTPGFETRSVTWTVPTEQVTARHRRTALFRETPDGWTLQHVRGVHLRQRGATESYLDADAAPEDLPGWVPQKVGIDVADRDGERRGENHA